MSTGMQPYDAYRNWSGGRISDQYWRSRYYFLASRGYTLRDHFRPERESSGDTDPVCDFRQRPYLDAPDGIDARSEDGSFVVVRRMETTSQELALLLRFSQPSMRSNPWNHCTPIHTTFDDPDDPFATFVVTPLLCPSEEVRFRNVDDIFNFIANILEGVAFFHAHGISHVIPAPSELPFPLGFDIAKVVDWGTVDPTFLSLSAKYVTDIWMHSEFRVYFAHLHHCKVEHPNAAVAPQAEQTDKPSPHDAQCAEGSTPMSMSLGGPATMTQDMKQDVVAVSARFIRRFRKRNEIALYFLTDFEEMLETQDPPDAVTALRKWRKLQYSLTWIKRRFWPVR
ncbi:hypothetical protein EIP91_004318 [Steccherinum ochraceum]|uniref:Protein kinase domain-containing protein n=1 Tax=Steccherinum ochraceum TaxID=92696 RepID=A0A4R0RHG6_9APHY|nr:hypothetical protein EIP91_004318 [Steccherinum ochraceum]